MFTLYHILLMPLFFFSDKAYMALQIEGQRLSAEQTSLPTWPPTALYPVPAREVLKPLPQPEAASPYNPQGESQSNLLW